MRREAELDATIHALVAAGLRGDPATLERLIAADYAGFDPTGKPLTRAMVLEAYGSGAVRLSGLEVGEFRLRVLGDTGVVTGTSYLRGVAAGAELRSACGSPTCTSGEKDAGCSSRPK